MKILFILVAILGLSGCATQTYLINSGPASAPAANEMQAFFVGGIGQEQKMDAASVCGGADKVVKVESKLEFLDWLLGGITWAIYTPRHAKVYCKR